MTLPNNIVACLLLLKIVNSANILFMDCVPTLSHHIYNKPLALELHKRGHNVTHVTLTEHLLPQAENYTKISINGVYKKLNIKYTIDGLKSLNPWIMIFGFQSWQLEQCRFGLESEGFQQLKNYPSTFNFDIIIFDISGGTCYFPLMQKFNFPPSIAISPFSLATNQLYSFGYPILPSIVPWFGLHFNVQMTFAEKLINYFFTYLDLFVRRYRQRIQEHELGKTYFGNDILSRDELSRHISLVLANTDPLMDFAQLLPPNIIPVAGLHTKPSEAVPEEFNNILNNAKNGVVIFSLGSLIRTDSINSKTRNAIIQALSKLNETIIWKYESHISDLPKNIHIKKFLPQNDLIGHPKVKLLIGHGGSLSSQEAIFYGVPTVFIPFISDQKINAKIFQQRQLGEYLDFEDINEKTFFSVIRQVLDNPIYAINMKKLSKSFRDRKETPLELAVYWVEHILRNGAPLYLSLPTQDMSFYELQGLDVLMFVLVATFLSVTFVYKIKKFTQLCKSKTKIKIN